MLGDSLRGSMDFLRTDARTVPVIALAACLAIIPFELSHLICMVAGAAGYVLFQLLIPRLPREKGMQKGKGFKGQVPATRRHHHADGPSQPSAFIQVPRSEELKPLLWSPSVMPVVAPTFEATDFEAQIRELLQRIAPCPEGDGAVMRVVADVQGCVEDMFPDATVAGYVVGNPFSGTAFGVAVPEVDVVVNVSLTAMLEAKQPQEAQDLAERTRQLQKSVLRSITDELTKRGGFKFRRSAFQQAEPRVTLVSSGPSTWPFNLAVNASQPSRVEKLLAAVGSVDARALDLILLVRRWAKDRGLSHAARGHFSPYIWTLLTIYFLQVGLPSGASPLPSLTSLISLDASGMKVRAANEAPPASTGELFFAFVRFYASTFDWLNEAVSIRAGRRAPPAAGLPRHFLRADRCSEVGPSIEDPFEASVNLGSCSTAQSLSRLHEELQRVLLLAAELKGELSVSSLLEPWAPSAEGLDCKQTSS